MVEHGKTYGSDEFQYKYQVYKNNLDFVTAHNLRDDVTFTVATNEFADLTNEEFVSMYTGYRGFQVKYQDLHELANEEPTPSAATVDWRTSGAVTPIKNQGQCGSCWSFSTTGSIEGNKQINTGTLTSLSEQNLMDCSWNQGNMGCDGGLMDYAFQYVISNMGIDTEASYPYTAESSQTCMYSAANSGATIKS
jgi:cathepsin L